MLSVTVSAENLVYNGFTQFIDENSPEHRAINIIKEMNLRTTPDQNDILRTISQAKFIVEKVEVGKKEDKLPLQILLNGTVIHMDAELKAKTNEQLREQNFYAKEREFCVIC
jgi:hypothetical protein